MNCKKCGQEVEGKFCANCGESIEETYSNQEGPEVVKVPNGASKNRLIKLLITIIVGVFGIHKFMEGKIGLGVAYLCTAGLFGVGWIVDIVTQITHLKDSGPFQLFTEPKRTAQYCPPQNQQYQQVPQSYETPEQQQTAIMQESLQLQRQMLQQQRAQAASQMRCPKCGCTSLSGNKKGFGIGKAVIGAAITGGAFGLVAGNLGAKKVHITCMSCGKRFWAGKR